VVLRDEGIVCGLLDWDSA